MFNYNFDFQGSLQAFLDAIFGFVDGLLSSVFGWLAVLFSSLTIP